MDVKQKLINSIVDENIFCKEVDTSIFVFEEKVKLLCFHCARYNNSWTCPPKIPDVDYQKIFLSYNNALLVYYSNNKIQEQDFDSIRHESTNILHKQLLDMEKICWDHNIPTAISFIGGSCKLCKNGCDKDKCRMPYLSRIPLEATGVNVVESLKKIGINIVFPPKKCLGRYGVLLF